MTGRWGSAAFSYWFGARKLQSRFKRGVIMLAIGLGIMGILAYRIHDRLTDDQKSAETAQAARADQPAAQSNDAHFSSGDDERPMVRTAADYAKLYTPLIANAPWSAPAFTNRQAQADPQLVCMSTGAGLDVDGEHRESSCRCVTEQGTLYTTPDTECRRMAREGPMYNPFKSPQRYQVQGQVGGVAYTVQGDKRGVGGGVPPTAMDANASAPSSGATISAPQVSGYGDIGVGQPQAAPR